MQQCEVSSPFIHVCLLYDLLHSLYIVAFSSGFNIVWVKDLLLVHLDFPRHASLRDTPPVSPEPYVTLDSRSSLIRTTFGVHTSFFPGSHLRVSCTPQVYLKNFVSQIRNENLVKCFLETFFIRTNSCANL